MSQWGREGSWHLTCDKLLALYIFDSYSNYFFPQPFLEDFQTTFIKYVFNLLNMKFLLKLDLKMKPEERGAEGGPSI
jgi:hypothetical protein